MSKLLTDVYINIMLRQRDSTVQCFRNPWIWVIYHQWECVRSIVKMFINQQAIISNDKTHHGSVLATLSHIKIFWSHLCNNMLFFLHKTSKIHHNKRDHTLRVKNIWGNLHFILKHDSLILANSCISVKRTHWSTPHSLWLYMFNLQIIIFSISTAWLLAAQSQYLLFLMLLP